MDTIKQGDNKVLSIIAKKKLNTNSLYRLSTYTVPYSKCGVHLLKNTLTGQTVRLTEDEWNAVNSFGCADLPYLEQHGFTQLTADRIIVEREQDDLAMYRLVMTVLKTMRKKPDGVRSYVIFPTTGCNARCVYCFEKDYVPKTMTSETVERLIDYISETRRDDKIRLRWFGGEPLAAAGIITHICKELTKRDIPFESSVVTNASLMTRELAKTAKNVWNLKKVQVSLDGDRTAYEERKRYIDPKKYNFDMVLQAVHFMADEGIEISIRCNYDWDNLDGLREFSDTMKREFGDIPNVSVYFAMLYQERNRETTADLYKKELEATRYRDGLGFSGAVKRSTNKKFKTNYCMADSMDDSVVIDPNGILYNCEHLSGENAFGNIFDGVTDTETYNRLKSQPEIDEQCKKCLFLPQCTPFYKPRCPGWHNDCVEEKLLRMEYELERLADRLLAEEN